MNNFRPIDRQTRYLLPPSVEDWLPERHLARFVVEIIDQLDLSAMSKAYRGSGSASYHPCLLVGLLVYGYATGAFSSRKLERGTYDSTGWRSKPPIISPKPPPKPLGLSPKFGYSSV
jgi:transposase